MKRRPPSFSSLNYSLKKARRPDAALHPHEDYIYNLIFSSYKRSAIRKSSFFFSKRAVLTSAAPLSRLLLAGQVKGGWGRHPSPPVPPRYVSPLPLPALLHCILSIIALNKTFLYIYLYVKKKKKTPLKYRTECRWRERPVGGTEGRTAWLACLVDGC